MAESKPTRPRRQRITRRSVRVAEGVAKTLISIGGICTIIAVSLICVFLLWVVVPLFAGAEVSAEAAFERSSRPRALHCGIDEYGQMSWVLSADGTLDLYRLDTGEQLQKRTLLDGAAAPSSSSFSVEDGSLALGFANGDVRLGTIGFSTRFVADAGESEAVRQLRPGERARYGEGLVERTPGGQLRVQELSIELAEPERIGANETGSGVILIDASSLPGGPVFVALTEDGELSIHGVHETENMLTGETTRSMSNGRLPYTASAHAELPRHLRLFGGGDGVVLAWRDGVALRFDTRDFDAAAEAEVVDFVPEPAAQLTALEFSLGKRTLIAGDSLGGVRGWFRTKPAGALTRDGVTLVAAHELASGTTAVTAIGASPASRTFAVAHADGTTRLCFMTSEKELGTARPSRTEPVTALAIAPREDSFVAFQDGGFECWRIESRHPEASVGALLRPVWYESFPEPEHSWQSGGGNDYESKLGLMPLIFGTLKATLYSMLFGVPIALLAAIFSSEFLHPRLRVALKSTIEIMASLPSVVLGFLAAVLIAPFVHGAIAAVLTALFAVPLTLLFGARVWQLLPQKLTLRWAGWKRFVMIGAAIPIGVLFAGAIAPMLEGWLFDGSLERWLDTDRGSGFGGWVFLLAPLSAFVVVFASGRLVDPWIRRVSHGWTRNQCARADLLRFVASVALAIAVAVGAAMLLGSAGFDPRGSVIGTYVQSNALIVGFVMGFAIIPIIYTLAEDALSSVPEHLRLASLGAGATQWQTAVRVIIPTAASGLFSAVMIGLGRAVGETMIVLMAAGGTAVMDWNMFAGFRTLSATIATELPESVQNSTLYRTLFLAALTLFAMTFVLNTVAEVVRQRFRKRAFQL